MWYDVNKDTGGASKNSPRMLNFQRSRLFLIMKISKEPQLELFDFFEEIEEQKYLDESEYYDDQSFNDYLNSGNDF